MRYAVDEIITEICQVPQDWIYKYYYRLFKRETSERINHPFDGRIIKVKSVLNRDSNPSLCFFYKNGNYFWKDFSTGVGGNSVKFVAYHSNKTESVAEGMIMRAYENYINEGNVHNGGFINVSEISKPEYDFILDPHNVNTQSWWDKFKITTDTLNRYKTNYCRNYKVIKDERIYSFSTFAFAYRNNDGVFQLYQPLIDPKYLYVKSGYLIGSEQLEFKSKFLCIASGLKDIMAGSEVGLDVEFIAPPSENVMITKDQMDFLRSKYQFIFSMLDYDKAGMKAMMRYKAIYDISPVYITTLKQDLAKNNEAYPLEKLKYVYTQAINKVFQ